MQSFQLKLALIKLNTLKRKTKFKISLKSLKKIIYNHTATHENMGD